MKPNKTLAQEIVERESLKIQRNPPRVPPGLKDNAKAVVEKAIFQHLEQFIQTALQTNTFEGESITLEHEEVLKGIRTITQDLKTKYEKKWKDLRK